MFILKTSSSSGLIKNTPYNNKIKNKHYNSYCILLIQTYENIIDYYKYDDATNDNSSKYDTTHMNLPFSYDSTNKHYYISNTRSNNGYHNYLIIDSLTVPRGVEISLDVNSSTSDAGLHEVLGGLWII